MIRFRIVFVSGGRFCKWGSWQTYPKKKQKYSTIFKILIREKGGGVVSEELETFLIFQKFYMLPQKSCGPTPLKFMFSICRKCLLPEKAPIPNPDVTCQFSFLLFF